MGAKKKVGGAGSKSAMGHIAARFPAATVVRIDALAKRLERDAPAGMTVRRSDALRAATERGLDAYERERAR